MRLVLIDDARLVSSVFLRWQAEPYGMRLVLIDDALRMNILAACQMQMTHGRSFLRT